MKLELNENDLKVIHAGLLELKGKDMLATLIKIEEQVANQKPVMAEEIKNG